MRNILSFLLVAILLQTVSAQSFQDTIPFRNDLGLIIISMKFNGVEKQFAFDTGAQKTLAYGWAKETLRPTRKTITITSSSGLKSKMRYYKSGKIELGSRKITGHRILNAPENEIFSCHKIDGILGVDIIDQLNWTIDYENKWLIMHPANYTPESVKNMHALNFKYTGSRPFVFLNRKGNSFKFLLDTGAGGDSNISIRNYKLTNLDEYEQLTYYTGNIDLNGIVTQMKTKMFQFPESTSKDVLLSPLIEYNNEKSTKIGNTLWKGKQLFLSLQKGQLYVSESKIEQSHAGYACSVMFRNKKMRISTIEVDSEPWKLGIRQGDEVRSINGKTFTDFCSMDQYRRQIGKSGQPFELEMMDGKKFTITEKESFK
jgi:hypothetical protein